MTLHLRPRIRCEALTKTGKQCKLTAAPDKYFERTVCFMHYWVWQHGPLEWVTPEENANVF